MRSLVGLGLTVESIVESTRDFDVYSPGLPKDSHLGSCLLESINQGLLCEFVVESHSIQLKTHSIIMDP